MSCFRQAHGPDEDEGEASPLLLDTDFRAKDTALLRQTVDAGGAKSPVLGHSKSLGSLPLLPGKATGGLLHPGAGGDHQQRCSSPRGEESLLPSTSTISGRLNKASSSVGSGGASRLSDNGPRCESSSLDNGGGRRKEQEANQASQDTDLVLAALKLIDMAGLLDLEDFSLHQWMFQTTVASQSLPTDHRTEKKFRPFSMTLKRLFEKRLESMGVAPQISNNASLFRTPCTTSTLPRAGTAGEPGGNGPGLTTSSASAGLQLSTSGTVRDVSKLSTSGTSLSTLSLVSSLGSTSSSAPSTVSLGNFSPSRLVDDGEQFESLPCIQRDTHLYDACRILNDTSIQFILARQSIEHETRLHIVAADFLSGAGSRSVDRASFQFKEYAARLLGT